MSKFKVGDRVKIVQEHTEVDAIWCYKMSEELGKNAVIKRIYNDNICQLDINNGVTDNGWWWGLGCLELVEQQPLTKTIITDIKDEEQADRICKKLESIGIKRCGAYKKATGSFNILQVLNNGDYIWYDSDEPSWTHITASEFLQEVDTDDNVYVLDKVPNGIIETKDFVPGTVWRGKGVADKLQELHNYKMPEVKGANKTNMNNIVSFFNDLTVSAEDKELRKAGLKNEDLNWTEEAKDIVKELEAKELGYINYTELKEMVDSNGLSPLEYHTLFTKYYTKLLDTAKKFNRKDEKKSK